VRRVVVIAVAMAVVIAFVFAFGVLAPVRQSSTTTESSPTEIPGAIVSFASARSSSTPHLDVTIANTLAEREIGLMNVALMGPDAGMLFVFPSDTSASFWMKNTLIPLSIAFVRADGTIVHIEDMQPETTTNHYSTEPYRYAIEANVGWFAAQGISAGDKAEIPSGISATSWSASR
jgi:uncharacterized membrane protein (UPF0127 family)